MDTRPVTAPALLASCLRAWRAGTPLSPRLHLLLGLLLPAALLAANLQAVWAFTVDDAYISFRYARNLARGDGLVYNPGEYVEGYTNFLWTVILAGFMKLGADPAPVAKILGAASAFGCLALTYALAQRLRPLQRTPCLATWLLASSIVFSGYAVFGLETAFFLLLVLAGMLLMLRERDGDGSAVPWSGIAFGLAGLTRPEAPLFIGLLMLFWARPLFGRQNLLRGVLFAAIVGAHLLFRQSYYGSWLPNTLGAKTGDTAAQLDAGLGYLRNYLQHTGPVLWFAVLGAASALLQRQRETLAITALLLAFAGYIALVGGDWMPLFRFISPIEPLAFLLADAGLRSLLDRREAALTLVLVIFLGSVAVSRLDTLQRDQQFVIEQDKHFWDTAAGGTARWFLQHGEPGTIAMGDIGYIGWATDYPVLDLLGLVDARISRMPGGYTGKTGPEWLDYLFGRQPRYILLVSSSPGCHEPSVHGSRVIYDDPRFLQHYRLAGRVRLDGGFAWCFFQRD